MVLHYIAIFCCQLQLCSESSNSSRGEEELRERELQSHPLSEFRVVNLGVEVRGFSWISLAILD